MNRSVLMIMGGALLVAIIVAMLVQTKLNGKTTHAVDTSNQILVTNKQLTTGEMLKPEDAHWEPWASGGMFKGVYKHEDYPDDANPPPVYNTPLRRTLEAGEPVTTQAIVSDVKGENNLLAAFLAPGMRAVGVSVSPSSAVGGFVAPGDHVDIVLSYQVPIPPDQQALGQYVVGRFASQTVLSNVKVLAVDQSSIDETHQAKISNVITVEVTREGAETLAMCKQMGELSLALRRIGEQDTAQSVVTPITTEGETSEVLRKFYEMMKKQSSSSGPNSLVRMYNGNAIENDPVRATGQ